MVKSKILITGSNGVLGNAFRRNKKLFNDYEIVYTTGRDCDLTSPQECNKLFEKIEPTFVFHLAAKSGGIGLSNEYQATLFRDNLLMAINIADNCVRNKVNKCIFTLSVGMYPENAVLPIKEKSNLTGSPHSSGTGYAYAKAILEPLIKTYSAQYKVNFIGLVPNGIYGPEDNFDPEHSAMLPSLIRKAYLAKLNNENLEVWGDGTPLRQYTFVDDYVHIYKWCINNFNLPEILNVGTSEELSIDHIAKLICKYFKIDHSKINYLTNKPKGIFRRPMDNSKFIKESGFKFTPLEDGIKETCLWFKKNKDFITIQSKS
ncbi:MULTISPECIES: NAD-dependent epimerase/dehydratase family protein [Prochlorococcus]|uniref:GDP-fucose synthetase n=1 Tax=Prochlorococcus marinus str. MIT 9314 TaxID=167548 RepID=A0A0A2AIF7_PROMR|nr:NAD-dependent epimerase/dehydratase family protein [Prochlorococcus marinus]KGG00315.1 GDP-fucose synthetase [Prochlorococcus marinus str. MIT 9314]